MEIKPAPAPAVAAGEARPPARPLIPVTLALIAGLLAGAWGVRLPGLCAGVGLGALWVLMVVIWARGGGVRVAPLAFFWLLGVAFYGQALHPFFPPHHLVHLPQDQELAIRGRLDRPARVGPERVQLFVKAEAWHGPQGWRPATGRLLVSAPALKPPAVGEEVILRGKLRTPKAFNNPGAADRARYLAADAIFRQLSLRQEDDLVVLAGSGAPPLREQLRGGIRQLLEELPPALKAMYLAILLGDQGGSPRPCGANSAAPAPATCW